jgi:hypothetical protein
LVPGANKGFTTEATEIAEKNGLAFLREFCGLSAIQLNPHEAELHPKLGELLYTHRSYLRAEEEFRTALQLDTGEARSLTNQ